MQRRGLMLLICILGAGCAAMGLNLLARDMGMPRHSIVVDSFGSAAFLAIVCVIAAINHRRTK
jgi:hypothetical protein